MNINKEKCKERSMACKITRATLPGLMGTLMAMSLVTAQQPGMSGHMSMETMIAQMLILPPLIFHLVAIWYRRTVGLP
jgi:hypothetical protein